MIRFESFKKLGIGKFLNEADSTDTLIKKGEEEISKKFDMIKTAKESKKVGDIPSKIQSINNQAQIYLDIANSLKKISALYQKKLTEKKPESSGSDIY